MLGTMQDTPLLVSRIVEHGRTVHGRSTVTTWTGGDELRRRTFRETGARAAQLAHGLADLGMGRGSVLATLMWNSVGKTLGL